MAKVAKNERNIKLALIFLSEWRYFHGGHDAEGVSHSCYMSMSETHTSPKPRNIRTNTSIIAASGHAARHAKGASDGGEHCDDYFEQLAPVEMSF